MAAGFERDVQGGAACRLACCGQGEYLGMRGADLLMPALADHLAIQDYDSPDERIGFDAATTPLGQLQGPAHPGFVGGVGHERKLARVPLRTGPRARIKQNQL